MNNENKVNYSSQLNDNYIESWKMYFKFYKRNLKYFLTIVFLTIIVASSTIFLPIITQSITLSAEKRKYEDLIFFSLMLSLIVIIKIFLFFFLNYLGNVFNLRLEKQIRRDMLIRFHKFPMERFDNSPSGIYFSRIVADLKEVNNYSYNAISDIITIIILSIGGFVYIFWVNWIVGVVILAIYLMSIFVYLVFFKKLAYRRQVIKKLNTAITVEVGENVEMVSEIKSYNSYSKTISKFDDIQENLYNYSRNFFWRSSWFKTTGIFASLLISTLTLIIGSFLVANNIIVNSQLIGLVASTNILIVPMERLSNFMNDTIIVNATMVRIKEFFSWKTEKNYGKLDYVLKGKLELKNIYFSYYKQGKEIKVFQDLNIKFKTNEKNLIYGLSKSGKSSILKLIMNYYEIKSGKVLIDDMEIHNYELDHLRKRIAYQSFYPRITLEPENIDLDHDKLAKILKTLKIDKDFFYEIIIDNPIYSQGLQISDSQKQIYSIAYTLYNEPDILLFDSIDLVLDKNQISLVNKAIHLYAKNKTVIFTSNNLTNKFNCSHIIKI